jgi:hypothetical protein
MSMGSLHQSFSECILRLEPEHLVGRAPSSSLRLGHRYVSGQHAVIRWGKDHWHLKDLGSRNGTFLDGARLRPGHEYPLRVGSTMSFGKAHEDEWQLADATPPCAMVVPVDGDEPILLESDFIALPSVSDLRGTIYRDRVGFWTLEQVDGTVVRLRNRQAFDVAGQTYRFCCPDTVSMTSLATSAPDLEVRHLQLLFCVSKDEEFVKLEMVCGGKTVEVGSRNFNYLLLTLARRRLKEQTEGLPDTTCGWIHLDELAHDPSMAPPQLNIDVYRIREQFAALGVVDAVNIVERRVRPRQLRIGVPRIEVRTI